MKLSLLKSTGILVFITFLSKVIGFAREVIIAYCYGAAFPMDAYFLAMGLVSNVLYAFTTASSVAFLPLYVEHKRDGKSQNFAAASIVAMGMVSLCVAGLIFCNADKIAKLAAPSYGIEELRYVELYMKILTAGVLFSFLANIFLSILNAERIYGYAAFSGIIYSATIVSLSLALQKRLNVLALVIAVPTAYFLQCMILFFRSGRFLLFKGRICFKGSRIDSLMKNAFPILLGNTVIELNQFVDRLLAVRFGDGAVSALSYANTLNSFVNSLFVGTLITMYFTEFSYIAAEKKNEEFVKTFKSGFLSMVILTLPIAYVILFCSQSIVSIVYGRGAFDETAVAMTSQAVVRYGIGFPFTILQAYLVKAFYAMGDTKSPTKNSMVCVAINIMLSVILAGKMGFNGIPLATSISTVLAVGLLTRQLRRRFSDEKKGEYGNDIGKIALVSAATCIGLGIMNKAVPWSNNYFKCFVNAAACFTAYFSGLVLTRCYEAARIWNLIKERLCKKRKAP